MVRGWLTAHQTGVMYKIGGGWKEWKEFHLIDVFGVESFNGRVKKWKFWRPFWKREFSMIDVERKNVGTPCTT